MKKGKFFLLTIICSFILPIFVNAAEKVPVYIFRGEGCGFCARAFSFFETLQQDSEYKDLFELVAYEVWSDDENTRLVEDVAKKLGDEYGGVPYIVIGEESFDGYTSSYDEDIKKAIKDLYNQKSRPDVVAEVLKSGTYDVTTSLPEETSTEATSEEDKTFSSYSSSKSDTVIAVIIIIVAVLGFGYIIYLSRKETTPEKPSKKELEIDLDDDDDIDDTTIEEDNLDDEDEETEELDTKEKEPEAPKTKEPKKETISAKTKSKKKKSTKKRK